MNCQKCGRYKKCVSPCEKVLKLLLNSKKRNGLYSDTTHENEKMFFISNKNIDFIDKILFTYGLSEIEREKTRRIVVAILEPREIKILKYIAKDKKHFEIAKKLNLSQGRISQIIKGIRKKIKEQFVKADSVIY